MDIEEQVKIERVKVLYKHSNTSLLGLLVLSSAILVFFWGKVEQPLMLGWFTALVVIIAGRMGLNWYFNTIAQEDINPGKWNWYFTIGSVLSAIVIGASAPLFMDFASPNSAIFLTLVMSGTVAGGMAALASFLPAFYLFSLICLIPLSFQFYAQGGELSAFAFFIILFLLMYYSYARNMHTTLTTSIRQRFENIELLKKLKEQTRVAEQANIDKSRFLAATSHDLRQPLHSLGLFLHILKEKLSTSEQKQVMAQAEKSQLVLNEQLNTIIDITRIDAGELSVNKDAFQLADFITDIVDEFSLSAKNADLTIRVRVANDWLNTDKVLLARIVRNFISNAIQHCPGATLLVATRRRGNKIELRFIDNGPGIAETDRENIFSEFYQLNNPERDRNKGLGLGLSIVKRLTELLDLKLKLTSQIGKGSTFTISLPSYITSRPAQTSLPNGDDKSDYDVAGLFIIVVDDENENLTSMQALLMLWQCEVLLASSKEELMRELHSNDYPVPDMILSDYRLREGENGFDIVNSVRQFFETKISGIIITGDTTIGLKTKQNIEGCEILYKPVSTEKLLNLLNRNASNKNILNSPV